MVIEVNPFKTSSINKAIKDLREYKQRLLQFPHLFIEAVAIRFDEILREEAPRQDLWERGEVEDTGTGARVVFSFQYKTQFIEFGTGIVGSQNHEGANMEWAEKLPPPYTGYESGVTINPITHEWRYWDGHRWIVTTGVPANPFMYRSVTRLIEECAEIANKVLGNIKDGSGQE